MIPEQPEERRALIGEYVLGLLESSDAAEVRELIESNQEAARMALEWEQHLLELSDELSEQTPSRALWLRIQRSLGHVPIEQMAVWRHWWDSAGLWRLTSGALALVVLLSWLSTSLEQDPALANESFTAVLQPPREAASPGWVVQVDMNGTLRLEALVDQPIPEDRSLQFWTLADPE
ncbi:MAG TPA: anti-sigma factor, partial [Pseudomonas xinjiangensis]|nr:anti-sigma factor [Halopseudomonas xinjiangensis]